MVGHLSQITRQVIESRRTRAGAGRDALDETRIRYGEPTACSLVRSGADVHGRDDDLLSREARSQHETAARHECTTVESIAARTQIAHLEKRPGARFQSATENRRSKLIREIIG